MDVNVDTEPAVGAVTVASSTSLRRRPGGTAANAAVALDAVFLPAVGDLLYPSRMRTVRGGISFAGVVGAAATGAYFGAAVAGLLALLTGQVFDAGSPWPAGAGVLAVLGAASGWLVARLTRLALTMNRRTLVFTVTGAVSFPLAVAIGQLHQVGSVGIGLVMIAGCASAVGHVANRRRRVIRRLSARSARVVR